MQLLQSFPTPLAIVGLLLAGALITFSSWRLYLAGDYENTTKRRIGKASAGLGVLIGAFSLAHFFVT